MEQQDNVLDYLKSNLEIANKQKYLQKIKKDVQTQNIESKQLQLEEKMEDYEGQYRKFMYTDTLLINSKSSHFLDECVQSVHSGLKAKKDCKTILSIISKVYVQEMIQSCLDIAYEKSTDKQQICEIDLDILQEAHRRNTKKGDKSN